MYIMHNLEQIDISEAQRDYLLSVDAIYDTFKDDPQAEVPENTCFYIEDSNCCAFDEIRHALNHI